jgi:hypothetical protein
MKLISFILAKFGWLVLRQHTKSYYKDAKGNKYVVFRK